jgi:UDPglucose--hexose-1-phosphate uridylyltransferase
MSAQAERRYDALSDSTVILATGRDARPHQFRASDGDADSETERCPFCPGHEAMTPPEVARSGEGEPDGPGWRVRVVPNLYPIVEAHEVVVLSPDHSRSFGALDDSAAIEVLTVLRDRVAAHLASGHEAAIAIINHKREAGASLPHPHAQVLATDFLPPRIEAAIDRARRAGADLVRIDAARDEALVLSNTPALAWCPYASIAPYQMRATHPAAGPRFDQASDEEVASVAMVVRNELARLSRALNDPPYNLIVHTVPQYVDEFHWYIEIIPRVSVIAGFELATGLFVNTVDPEHATKVLRDAAR